jgi:pentatricopeptide repeat protein
LQQQSALGLLASAAGGSGNWTSASQLNGLDLGLRPVTPAAAHGGVQPGSGFSFFSAAPEAPEVHALAASQPVAALADSTRHGGGAAAAGPRSLVNEVVCGALMLAYERAGMWEEAVRVLSRARALGVEPNTVMINTVSV